MLRKLLFVIAATVVFSACATNGAENARPAATASPAFDPVQLGTAVTAKEKAVWEAIKNKQFDEARKLWADEYTGVYDHGILNVEQDLAATRDFALKSYTMTDIKTTIPNRETAVISYKATVTAMIKGKDVSGTYHVASVWRERNGDWQTVLHTDMKAQ